jgi:AcrR family transcriptional regulator
VSEPAYTRLDVDERRRRLLERGAELFARHSYDELSMAAIAREAGVSKALLYHYFPSKQDFFGAVLAEGAAERVAVNAWLWFMDGAIVDWLEHRDLDRAAVRALLLRALEGALGEPL